jgi:hypothetical protein
MKKNILAIIAIIILLAVGGGAFYGGIIYGKSQNARPPFAGGNFPGANGNKTGVNSANGANFILGDIISKDATSITVQLPNNAGSKMIFYSGTTQINKMATATPDDLSVGTTVSVTGTTNPDGSVTAQNIQLRPTTPVAPK